MALGLTRATAARQVQDLLRRLPDQAESLLNEVVQENAAMLRARPELAATLARRLQCLRAIRHIVIHEIVARLQKT